MKLFLETQNLFGDMFLITRYLHFNRFTGPCTFLNNSKEPFVSVILSIVNDDLNVNCIL